MHSTLHDATRVADGNGSLIEGESKIPSPGQPITRVHLKPDDAELNPDAKAAILMGLTGLDAEGARRQLASAGGVLRKAMP